MKRIIKFIKQLFSFKKNKGHLTIVGVGPGNPSLLTIEAVKVLKKSKIIFYPISSEDKTSYSAKIVKRYIKNKKQIPLIFPMGKKEYSSEEIWRNGADKIVSYINKKYSVALLCLGDSSIYASSTYIRDQIKEYYPQIRINIIPGISSLSLAAAMGDFQLIKQGENLEILECPDTSNELTKLIRSANKKVLVIMKVGKRWSWVKNVLTEENILQETLLASNLGMKNQFVGKASEYFSEELPYFSILLLRL